MLNKIAVITARGGSKRIPKKNIKNFWKNDSVGEFFSILYISQIRETFSLLHIAGFGIEKQ